LIIIIPLVVLQTIVALMFVERQSSLVTYYLSSAVTQEIATLIDVYKAYPQSGNRTQLLRRIAQDRLGLQVDFLPWTDLPPPGPKPLFSQLDDARNEDEGGTGLGLAIARDIARSHGGDIALGASPLGGLRATVKVPV
jgi:two-component system osmolarity sensor histidine kinase EnvZ